MNHEENIKKIDKMSHQDLIRNGHQYKDYLNRHPKSKALLKAKDEFGLAKHKKMFESSEHRKGVAEGKAKEHRSSSTRSNYFED